MGKLKTAWPVVMALLQLKPTDDPKLNGSHKATTGIGKKS
jgi:hypothetical protein